MVISFESVLAIFVAINIVNDALSPNPTTESALPGSSILTKGYNLLQGDALWSQNGVDLIDYQWNGRLIAPFGASQTVYEIPIEWESIPNVAPICTSETVIKSIYHSTSTSVLTEQSTSFQGGYKQPVELGITVPLGGVSVEAKTSYTNSLMFGYSQDSNKARYWESKSYSWSFSMDTVTTLYQAAINWNDSTIDFQWRGAFTNAVNALDNNPSNSAILSFISSYGTHVISNMKAGASCHQTAYIQSSGTEKAASDFKQTVRSNSASFLFWSADLEKKNAERKASTTVDGIEYEFDNIYCWGEVAATSACGGVTGTANSPVATSYIAVTPIWDIGDVANLLSNTTLMNIDIFFDTLYETMKTCSQQFCNFKGTCTLSNSIWSSTWIQNNWDGTDFSKLWNTTANGEAYCFCNPGYIGKNCSKKEPTQAWYWELFTKVTSQYIPQDGQNDRTSDNFPNWSGLHASRLMFVDNAVSGTTYRIKEDKTGHDDTWWSGLMNASIVTAKGNDGDGHGLYVANVAGPGTTDPTTKYNTFTVFVYQQMPTVEPTASPTMISASPTTIAPIGDVVTQDDVGGCKQYGYLFSTMMSILFAIYIC
eukprot:386550_1